MICSQCGANNSDEAFFCQKCGKRLEATGQNESTLLSPPPVSASPYENFSYTVPGSSEPNYPPPPPDIPYQSTSNPYEPKPPLRSHSNRRYLIVIAILVTILLTAGSFELGQLLKGNSQGNTNTPPSTATPSPVPGSLTTEAENIHNTLGNGAAVRDCPKCSGGQKVINICKGGFLQFNDINVSGTSSYSLEIYYVSGDSRIGYMSVNGASPVKLTFGSGPDWDTPIILPVTIALNSGRNTIKFYNDTAWAPDIDKITIEKL